MTSVDKKYIDIANLISKEGTLESQIKGANVRPRWTDGSPAYTKFLPQVFTSYKEGELPLINLRKIAWRSAIREILWIYQDKSPDVNLLEEKHKVNYWNEWKLEDGTLGKSYGYQTGKKFISPESKKLTDQVDRLLDQLKNNPLNRRLIINLYDVDDLSEMSLIPCAFMTMWTTREDKLDMTLIQRSGDFLAAAAPGNINAFQYYALLLMVARATGLKPGNFCHLVQNLHIYDRHMDIVNEIIKKEDSSKKEPKLKIRDEVTDFYKISVEDFILEDYNPDQTKYQIEIAI